MGTRLISVVVAVYNTSEYLEQCLSQILNQTMPREQYEIIVVNDCSTDSSMEIVNRFKEQDPEIIVVDKKQNEATFWCRYDGMSRAAGKYVLFADSDDWIERDMLERLYCHMEKVQADILEFAYYINQADGQEIMVPLKEGAYTVNAIVEMICERKVGAALWHRLFRMELIRNALDYIDSHCGREEYRGIRNEDEYLFPLLLGFATRYYAIEEAVMHYRVGTTGSIMQELERSADKKCYHAHTLLHAGRFLIAGSRRNRMQHSCYIRMQCDNLFYLIGIIQRYGRKDQWEIVRQYFAELQAEKGKYRPARCMGWNMRLLLRYAHLRWKLLRTAD